MPTIFGSDMSHYDAAPANLGAQLTHELFGFGTHKAGGDALDPEMASWWNAVKRYRITEADLPELANTGTVAGKFLPGSYWVLYPGNPSGRADAFVSRLDSQAPGWRDAPFILQADCEDWTGDGSTKPGRSDIRAFCDRLRARVPAFRPIVYASHGQYRDTLSGLGYPLWNANYPSRMTGSASAIYQHIGGDSGAGWDAYSGQTPAIWQFSSSATIAGQSTSDANAYRGSLADLVALTSPGWSTDMALTDDDVARIVTAVKNADINPDPGVTSSLSGSLWTILSRSNALNSIPSANDNAQAVLAALPTLPVQEIADVLKALLGADAPAVGALLQL